MSLVVGDCRDTMRSWIAAGVRAQMCVTSPPYWGLRDYGVAGALGLEPTIAEYVANMVEVFRLVREILAEDGTLWLNLGDSYSSGGRGGGMEGEAGEKQRSNTGALLGPKRPTDGLKPKDLCGIPWRLAFALQADGWYLRSDIIWAKPNPMPESVTDRPTKAHEYLFLLSKRERYYYDAAAIAEPVSETAQRAIDKWKDDPRIAEARRRGNIGSALDRDDSDKTLRIDNNAFANPPGRNKRSVWTITTEPYAEAHFATFPVALVEPSIMAGTSEKGHCPACGNGWERVTEITEEYKAAIVGTTMGPGTDGWINGWASNRKKTGTNPHTLPTKLRTLGWQPTCACGLDPVPGVVLDPFMGSGTVAQVAQDLGRRWLGCELSPEYAKLIDRRTAQQALALAAD